MYTRLRGRSRAARSALSGGELALLVSPRPFRTDSKMAQASNETAWVIWRGQVKIQVEPPSKGIRCQCSSGASLS